MKTRRTVSHYLLLTLLLPLLLMATTLHAATWTPESVPNVRANDIRLHTVDPENLLDDASQAAIDQLLHDVESTSTAEVMVVALKTVGDVYIKDFATELFNHWKIGNAIKDNGLLILMVDDQGKISFETGYGLEGVLPDAICARIIQNDIIPYMKEGSYGKGLLSGVTKVVEILKNPAVVEEIKADIAAEEATSAAQQAANKAANARNLKLILIVYLVLSVAVLVFSLMSVLGKRYAVETKRVSVPVNNDQPTAASSSTAASSTTASSTTASSTAASSTAASSTTASSTASDPSAEPTSTSQPTTSQPTTSQPTTLRRSTKKQAIAKVTAALSPIAPYQTYKDLATKTAGYTVLAVLFPLTMVFFLVWMKRRLRRLRVMPRVCTTCQQPMMRLNEKQEDAYLSSGQQAEELVGSVDYDAWVCLDCSKREILPYNKTFTQYRACPSCGYKTFAQVSDRIVVPPTPLSTGKGERIHRCNHCKHEIRKTYIIPMIIIVPTNRRGGGGFGGGFGGGGFGGGSFGGGMSGGGGATGGWR